MRSVGDANSSCHSIICYTIPTSLKYTNVKFTISDQIWQKACDAEEEIPERRKVILLRFLTFSVLVRTHSCFTPEWAIEIFDTAVSDGERDVWRMHLRVAQQFTSSVYAQFRGVFRKSHSGAFLDESAYIRLRIVEILRCVRKICFRKMASDIRQYRDSHRIITIL